MTFAIRLSDCNARPWMQPGLYYAAARACLVAQNTVWKSVAG